MFEFAFSRQNYLLLLGGILILVLGYTLMSGGGSDDPNVFLGDYSITDESIELLQGDFQVDEAVLSKVSGLKGQVFESEEALMSAIEAALSAQEYADNKFQLRSSAHIDADIFSARRITFAPIIALLGYAFIIYAIMKKPGARRRESAHTT